MSEPTLRPCPFCGGSGLGYVSWHVQYSGPVDDANGALSIDEPGNGWFNVRCRDCGATGPTVHATRAKAYEKAVGAWNRRDGEGRLL